MSDEAPPPAPFLSAGTGVIAPTLNPTALGSSRTPQLAAATLARWFDIDGDRVGAIPKPSVKPRRRLAAGLDHIKHRRTRSGCYTCRSRRVKCDEAHPICERCKKGSRQCIYPEPVASSRGTASKLGRLRPTIESDSSGYEDVEDDVLPGVPEEAIGEVHHTRNLPSENKVKKTSQKQAPKKSRINAASRAKLKSRSPSTEASTLPKSRSTSVSVNTPGQQSMASTDTSLNSSAWSHLPYAVQEHLEYHRHHLSHHHYLFKHDSSQFIRSTLLEIALEYDPLLYAVVGFSSFHSTLPRSDGRIEDFLAYYNKSVQLLRKSLTSEFQHTDATILTILQLATFEEFLGDWVNLLGHQKAACEMIFELYTPETIMGSQTSRNIIHWYMHFDLFAGLMSGSDLKLGREWFAAYAEYWHTMVRSNPENVDFLLESLISDNMLVGTDMALLFAKLPRGAISMADFAAENAQLQARIRAFGDRMQSLVRRQDCLVTSFAGAPPRSPAEIVDPYQPGGLYAEPLWSLNYVLMDRCAIDAMHKLQTSMVTQQDLSAELVPLAMEQCRIFEAIEMWPESRPGSLLPAQATCGLVALLLPREDKYIMWCRRKLAKIESMGYIYPTALRSKLSSLWSLPSVMQWWLPDEEPPGYPPLMRAIRAFIEDRAAAPRSQAGKDVRSMKAMFESLAISDSTAKGGADGGGPRSPVWGSSAVGPSAADKEVVAQFGPARRREMAKTATVKTEVEESLQNPRIPGHE